MTREDSILTKTWVTNDGRYLTSTEIPDDHLRALRVYLRDALTPASDAAILQTELAAWMADHAAGMHAIEDEMDLDVFRAGWIQIVEEEITRRLTCQP